jgi:hypothetical protein
MNDSGMRRAMQVHRSIATHVKAQGMLSYRGGDDVAQMEWEWPMADCLENHSERVALLRPIPYEMTTPVEGPAGPRAGKALSLNISSGGMLVLMDQAPTPVTVAETPTLAEVRWTRKMPIGKSNGQGAYFVGLKFMF